MTVVPFDLIHMTQLKGNLYVLLVYLVLFPFHAGGVLLVLLSFFHSTSFPSLKHGVDILNKLISQDNVLA